MKATLKRVLTLGLALCLLGGLAAPALAAEETPVLISAPLPDVLVFAGENVVVFDDVGPEFSSDGVVMLPLRKVMESLGADVGYDNATRKITVKHGGTTVSFAIGSKVATVSSGGKTVDYTMAAAPMYISGRTLVSGSMLHDCFQLMVSSTTGMVAINDLGALAAEIDKDYTIMNKIMSVSADPMATYKTTGTYSGKVSAALPKGDGTNANLSLPLDGTISMTNQGNNLALQAAMSVGLDGIAPLILDKESQDMIALIAPLLKDISVQVLFNEQGTMYVSCPLLMTLLSLDADWIAIDLKELGVDMSLMSPQTLTFGQLMAMIMDMESQVTFMNYDMLQIMLTMFDGVCSDKRFVVTGTTAQPTYTLTMTTDSLISLILTSANSMLPEEEQLTKSDILADLGDFTMNMKMSYTITGAHTYKSSVSLSMSLAADGNKVTMDVTGTQNLPGNSAMNLTFAIVTPEMNVSVSMKYDLNVVETEELAITSPPPGAKIVTIEELIKALELEPAA